MTEKQQTEKKDDKKPIRIENKIKDNNMVYDIYYNDGTMTSGVELTDDQVHKVIRFIASNVPSQDAIEEEKKRLLQSGALDHFGLSSIFPRDPNLVFSWVRFQGERENTYANMIRDGKTVVANKDDIHPDCLHFLQSALIPTQSSSFGSVLPSGSLVVNDVVLVKTPRATIAALEALYAEQSNVSITELRKKYDADKPVLINKQGSNFLPTYTEEYKIK